MHLLNQLIDLEQILDIVLCPLLSGFVLTSDAHNNFLTTYNLIGQLLPLH